LLLPLHHIKRNRREDLHAACMQPRSSFPSSTQQVQEPSSPVSSSPLASKTPLPFQSTPTRSPQPPLPTCSTLTLSLALVSRNGIPYSSARALPELYDTALLSSAMSDLFPTRICAMRQRECQPQPTLPIHTLSHAHVQRWRRTLSTLSEACSSMFFIQLRMLLKLASSVMSYTSKIPMAPR
jgi:hypothetical protein